MNKLFQSVLLMLLAFSTYGQCLTYTINGDLSQNIAFFPNSTNPIGVATGYSPIHTNITATYNPANIVPSGFPTPGAGHHVQCLIQNHALNSTSTARGGFKVELNQLIAKGTGKYELSFDIACKKKDPIILNNLYDVEIGVYGVYNPTGAPSTVPITGPFTPSNMSLYGSSNTIFLKSIQIGRCTEVKETKTVIIDSDVNTFPANGITHFFITDDGVPATLALDANRTTAFDDFCVKAMPIDTTPIDTIVIDTVPCPTVTTGSWLTFLSDINGDGKVDRTMTVEVFDTGTVNFIVDCGTVTPASVTGPGIYTLTVLSSPSCDLTSLDYVSFDTLTNPIDTNSTPCGGGQLFYDGTAGCPTGDDILFSNEGAEAYCWTGYATLVGHISPGGIDWSWTIRRPTGSVVSTGTTTTSGNHGPIYYQSGNLNGHTIELCAKPSGGCPEICTTSVFNCGRGFGNPIGNPIQRVAVSPNPSNGLFTVNAPKGKEIERAVVVNGQGNPIKAIRSERSGMIDLSRERQGLYFVKVFYTDGTTEAVQLQLQK